MVELLEWIGRGSLAPFWAPVLIWTGLAGAGALVMELGAASLAPFWATPDLDRIGRCGRPSSWGRTGSW